MIDILEHIAKSNKRAFVLREDKVELFMKRAGSSKKVMDRFYSHKPKAGVITPSKRNI